MSLTIRVATHRDLVWLHPVIERAYRGDAARLGWTHEADHVTGERTDLATLAAIVEDPASRLLIAFEGGTPIGCIHVADRCNGLAYLGLLCVEPVLQAAGIGKRLIDAAERLAREEFGGTVMEMTVIEARAELIAYYERRGYRRTGERRPFPIALDPPLYLAVMAKPLD